MLIEMGFQGLGSLAGDSLTNLDGFVISVHADLCGSKHRFSLGFSPQASHFVFFLGGNMPGS